MASADNVRVRYEDGLILGAAQLSGDQTYFRAALERRSLTRDMFGIAWGLELTVDTAAPGAATSAVVWVEPGVAYGGDGKPIVVRDRSEISPTLNDKRKTSPNVSSWAIYLVFQESDQNGKQTYQFCGQAMDPIKAESFRFDVAPLDAPIGSEEREGARVAPQSGLAGPSDARQSRIQLGVVSFDLTIGNPAPELQREPGALVIPEPAPAVTQAALNKDSTRPLAHAEYIGLVGAAIAHPRQWTASLGDSTLRPAIVLEPGSGIHLEQPTVVHSNARVEQALYVGGPIVANNAGICVVLRVDSAASPAQLLNMAVAWNTDPTGDGVIAARKTKEQAKVLGIVTSAEDATSVRVVVGGAATATLTNGTSAEIGDWLLLDDKGTLVPAISLPTSTGLLIGKVIGAANAQHQVPIIVCLG